MAQFTYISIPVRSTAILTGTYVANPINLSSAARDVYQSNQLVLLVNFTKGSLTTAEMKIEFSNDNTNWYQEVTESVTAGVISEVLSERQFSATGKYRIPVPIKDRYIRVSVKGTGTTTGSDMVITAVVAEA